MRTILTGEFLSSQIQTFTINDNLKFIHTFVEKLIEVMRFQMWWTQHSVFYHSIWNCNSEKIHWLEENWHDLLPTMEISIPMNKFIWECFNLDIIRKSIYIFAKEYSIRPAVHIFIFIFTELSCWHLTLWLFTMSVDAIKECTNVWLRIRKAAHKQLLS